jgi:hypothetical protein
LCFRDFAPGAVIANVARRHDLAPQFLAARYAELLADLEDVERTNSANWNERSVQPAKSSLLDQGIATRGIMCSHRESAYANEKQRHAQSEIAQDHSILLPIYTQMMMI